MAERDLHFMLHAVRLAARGLGHTAPNPCVGCVLVKDGIVIGTGRSADGGRPHAEPLALEQAGEKARGATAYVTMEPCSHHGKTPPCAEALINAGIARVVIACTDPDPRVNGSGITKLKEAGTEVITGVGEAQARRTLAGFFLRVQQNRPFITLKIATSLDGFMATVEGKSQWITGEEAREYGHMLRANHDAILTGIGTVLADDPALTCRIPGLETHSPKPYVLDRSGRLPAGSKLAQAGATVLAENSLPDVLAKLASDGVMRLLVEAGPTLSSAFLKAGLVDELYWFRAPIVMGAGKSAFAGFPAGSVPSELVRWNCQDTRSLGKDRLEIYTPPKE